jgi:hypothetical protein
MIFLSNLFVKIKYDSRRPVGPEGVFIKLSVMWDSGPSPWARMVDKY